MVLLRADEETWTQVETVVWSHQNGATRREEEVNLRVTVSVGEPKDDGSAYGWFEWYSTDSSDWYASGGLWFRDGELVDYDGVFSLSHMVLKKLHEWGYDVTDVADSCEVVL